MRTYWTPWRRGESLRTGCAYPRKGRWRTCPPYPLCRTWTPECVRYPAEKRRKSETEWKHASGTPDCYVISTRAVLNLVGGAHAYEHAHARGGDEAACSVVGAADYDAAARRIAAKGCWWRDARGAAPHIVTYVHSYISIFATDRRGRRDVGFYRASSTCLCNDDVEPPTFPTHIPSGETSRVRGVIEITRWHPRAVICSFFALSTKRYRNPSSPRSASNEKRIAIPPGS